MMHITKFIFFCFIALSANAFLVYYISTTKQPTTNTIIINNPIYIPTTTTTTTIITPEIPKTKKQINKYLETKYNLPSNLLSAIHSKETSNRCNVESKANAKGCFQFVDITIADLKQRFDYTFDPYNYEESANAAAILLSYYYSRIVKHYPTFTDEVFWGLALAGYNAGLTNAFKWAKLAHKNKVTNIKQLTKLINYKETKRYVEVVITNIYIRNKQC